MIHHKGDIILRKRVQRGSFRDDSADQSMVVFSGSFLIRGLGVAVKYPCSASILRIFSRLQMDWKIRYCYQNYTEFSIILTEEVITAGLVG